MTGLDLGIADRTALVCGASKGLGRACAEALSAVGVRVVLCARTAAPLEAAAADIAAAQGQSVATVVADVTTEAGREAILRACPNPDILINNSAGPPPGRFEGWGAAEWEAATSANMIAPILLMRAVLGGMRARRWGRIINITSSAVKQPLPMLGLSNGARAGLTGFVSTVAREVAADGVTINNLLPGRFATDRLESYVAAVAQAEGVTPEELSHQLRDDIPAGRFGRADEFGAVCAFLASEHAGYITAQNILLDGGAYPGIF
ncbi:MAG: SDR family oxidoreductase [Hyphomonadaceae bacterium]|nr:SDR family oxidoreductase [Hyphomonadaceae bacterium]